MWMLKRTLDPPMLAQELILIGLVLPLTLSGPVKGILFRLSLIAITRRDAGKFGFLIMIS